MIVVFMRILKFFCALFVLELLLLFFPIFFDFRKLFSMLEKIYNKVLIMGEAAMYDRYAFFPPHHRHFDDNCCCYRVVQSRYRALTAYATGDIAKAFKQLKQFCFVSPDNVRENFPTSMWAGLIRTTMEGATYHSTVISIVEPYCPKCT